MTLKPLKGLHARREFRGLTQDAMGAMIAVSQSHYRRFETGEVRLDIHRAKTLADALGCSIEELM
jgi:transcriptional regulator with XRE-family HTH domain